jgi:superfamily II DNA helicase RecQ
VIFARLFSSTKRQGSFAPQSSAPSIYFRVVDYAKTTLTLPPFLLLRSLAFQVEVASSLDKKLDRLVPLLKSRTGPAIIYVTLQKHAEEIANRLRPHNMEPMVYHAGLPHEQRAKVQMEFMESAKGIVCATIAFGMGIDKGTLCYE